jgi:hypothetical protein
MKNYVGRKIRGFRFEDGTDGVYWNYYKENLVSKIGAITHQDKTMVKILFEDCHLYYPISLIEPHLIEEEEPEISGLEALFIVHGGWHGEEQELLYKKCVKIILEHKQRLQSIYINTKPKYTHAELVEKLGEDFIYEK